MIVVALVAAAVIAAVLSVPGFVAITAVGTVAIVSAAGVSVRG